MVTQIVLYILIVFVGTAGEMCVSRAMKTIGEVTDFRPGAIARVIGRAMTVHWMWIGIGLLLAFFVAYLLVLTWADYSYVQPASSASYVFIAILAHFILREEISLTRWAGVAVICAGVFLVGYTHPQTPEPGSW